MYVEGTRLSNHMTGHVTNVLVSEKTKTKDPKRKQTCGNLEKTKTKQNKNK